MIDKPILEVCFSPALLHLYNLEDTVVVVIDIFRATSTICAALGNGAKEVIPIASVEECMEYAKRADEYITAGERDGKVIEGLHHGNSPSEYSKEVIDGKTLVLTTTNGTKLLHMCKNAETIVIGSFLNLDALCNYLIERNKKVLLACSAWKDRVNMEDSLFAGAVVHHIKHHFELACDSAQVALSLYESSNKHGNLIDSLKEGSHFKRLSKFGLENDMEYCTSLNLHPIVPLFNGKALVCASKLV